MAVTRVFIDDAVTGQLPDVCVKDGVPAHGSRLTLSQEVGAATRLGVLWLLVFVGPLGWLLLAILWSPGGGERLTVELPLSTAARHRIVDTRRERNAGTGIAAAAALLFLALTAAVGLGPAGFLLALVAAAIGLGVWLVGEYRLGRATVDIQLDASRRWLTIRGVHPDFAAACATWRQDSRRV